MLSPSPSVPIEAGSLGRERLMVPGMVPEGRDVPTRREAGGNEYSQAGSQCDSPGSGCFPSSPSSLLQKLSCQWAMGSVPHISGAKRGNPKMRKAKTRRFLIKSVCCSHSPDFAMVKEGCGTHLGFFIISPGSTGEDRRGVVQIWTINGHRT